ncbi:hypothetical protein AAA137_00425 [Phocaeicola vulgatus]|jgi:hypothetical protein
MKTSFILQKVKETLRDNWLEILLAIILVLLLLLTDVSPRMIIV